MPHMTWFSMTGKNRIRMPASVLRSKDNSTHMVGSLVTENTNLLFDGEQFIQSIRKIVARCGATTMGHHVVQFKDDVDGQAGYSASLVLAESHISIHTWPEMHMAELDVYLCNVLQNNRTKCRRIFQEILNEFNASETVFVEVPRPNLHKLRQQQQRRLESLLVGSNTVGSTDLHQISMDFQDRQAYVSETIS